MKSEITFGILFAAIIAVGAGTLTTVLDNVVQDADAAQPGGQGPPPPGQTGGGGGGGQQGPGHGAQGPPGLFPGQGQ